MRWSSIRSFGAALALVPFAATCTPPQGMVASAHEQVQSASEDRLIRFLIDGEGLPRRP